MSEGMEIMPGCISRKTDDVMFFLLPARFLRGMGADRVKCRTRQSYFCSAAFFALFSPPYILPDFPFGEDIPLFRVM